ncbi:MAG TPA: hypothetical protein VFG83_08420 [Kofleriaceae bacterium]|nr:hypothetical protein [Kofleriaceae bacterium]
MTASTAHQCGGQDLSRQVAMVEGELHQTLGGRDAGQGAENLARATDLLRRYLTAEGRDDESPRGRHYRWFADQLDDILAQADTPRELARLLEDVIRVLRFHIES